MTDQTSSLVVDAPSSGSWQTTAAIEVTNDSQDLVQPLNLDYLT
jgi:hypothetical protein